jgi:ATP-dependent RNA circularization protein (DNA/RNA ligase family)
VCGRNYSYKESDTHTFWKLSRKYDIENKLREYYEKTGKYLALQGEIVGPGIQANRLGLPDNDLYVFNVVHIREGFLPITEAIELINSWGMNFVPIIDRNNSFNYGVEDCLNLAKGKYAEHFPSAKPSQDREGIVIRSVDGTISFKAINNDFLLKGGD